MRRTPPTIDLLSWPMTSDRTAWNVYWAAFAVFVVVLLAFALSRGAGIGWGLIVAAPLLVAGVNLVARSDSHERVCAIEVGRHSWLRVLTMGGYSRQMFVLTGVAEIAFAVVLIIWIAARTTG
jgi:hypothetical protein